MGILEIVALILKFLLGHNTVLPYLGIAAIIAGIGYGLYLAFPYAQEMIVPIIVVLLIILPPGFWIYASVTSPLNKAETFLGYMWRWSLGFLFVVVFYVGLALALNGYLTQRLLPALIGLILMILYWEYVIVDETNVRLFWQKLKTGTIFRLPGKKTVQKISY